MLYSEYLEKVYQRAADRQIDADLGLCITNEVVATGLGEWRCRERLSQAIDAELRGNTFITTRWLSEGRYGLCSGAPKEDHRTARLMWLKERITEAKQEEEND